MNLKKRIDRIRAQIGAVDVRAPLRSFADFVKWGTERRAANGGELKPEDATWIESEFKKFVGKSEAQR